MSRRTFAYIALAVLLLVGGRLLSTGAPNMAATPTAEGTAEAPLEPPVAPSFPVKPTPPPAPLKRPPSSVMEVGVLCDRTAEAAAPLLERDALAAAIAPKLCGDEAACQAVKATLRDEHATTLDVVPASAWGLERIDVEQVARNLTAREQAGLKAHPRIVVVHVNTATSPRQLALRTATAAAATLAQQLGGLVWDQLLARVETPHDFAAHAVTEPLDRPTFRRDRIELLYQPRDEGVVRILTGGLSRWGVADVEMPAVPSAAADCLGDVVLGVAAALANGALASPVTVSRDDLGRARGQDYASDAGMPASVPVELDIVSVHPENGDPNDFMARIEPPDGEGLVAAMGLAERFFGSLLAASPGAGALGERKGRAQAGLASAVARWSAAKGAGARLLVMLPFGIPGEGGIESMWIDVTRVDGARVTGKVLDDPLGATDVHKGDEVTRPRGDVEDLDLRVPKG